VCLGPGYRGHCVPCAWVGSNRGVWWCGGGIVRFWICKLIAYVVASLLVLLFLLLLATAKNGLVLIVVLLDSVSIRGGLLELVVL
jgi:hypothetical protein